MGRDYDGLIDALTGGLYIVNNPIEVKWINFEYSNENFKDKNDLSIIIDILAENCILIIEN